MFEEQFDDILREKLLDHESPVPAGAWERLWRQPRRRFGGFWWIWVALGLPGLLAGGYFWRAEHLATSSPAPGISAAHLGGKLGLASTAGAAGYFHNGHRDAGRSNGLETSPGQSGRGNDHFDGTNGNDHFDGTNGNDQFDGTNGNDHFDGTNLGASKPGADLPFRPPIARPIFPKSAKAQVACPILREMSPRWAIDIYGSPDFGHSKIYNTDSSLYLHAGPKIKLKSSYSFGATVSRYFGPHVSVRTGLQYSSVYFGFPSVDSAMPSIRINSLDLPLWIGYGVGQHFRATLEGGALFRLYTWNTQFHPVQYTVHNPLTSVYLGLNLAQPVDKHFLIFVEPYIRYRFSQGLSAESIYFAPWQRDLKLVEGVSFGIRYRWGRFGHER